MGVGITTIAVYPKDAKRLWKLREDRKVIPKKKLGRGRPPADKETFAEIFACAVEALHKERR